MLNIVKHSTVLLLATLILPVTPLKADIYIQEDPCKDYAAKAVYQQRTQLAARCGFSGLRWSEDGAGQHHWCRTVRPREIENETSARASALMKCLNPQGDINPNDIRIDRETLSSEMLQAIGRGATERFQQLIAAGADFTGKQDSMMSNAIQANSTKTLVFLKRMGLKLSKPGANPLNLSIDYGEASKDSLKTLEWLLSQGADPNHTGSDKRTPLQSAIERQNTKALALLLKYRADPNLDVSGKPCSMATPLDSAIDIGKDEMIALLRKAGAKTQVQLCSKP